MGRKAVAELEKKDIILYKGDWATLDTILAPRKITVTQFIRELVHRKLKQIEAAAQDVHKTVETPDVLGDADLTDLTGHDEPTAEGRSEEPAGSL